jgi:hypothetical protein
VLRRWDAIGRDPLCDRAPAPVHEDGLHKDARDVARRIYFKIVASTLLVVFQKSVLLVVENRGRNSQARKGRQLHLRSQV